MGGRPGYPVLWLVYGLVFTCNALVFASVDGPAVVVVLSAVTGIAAVATFLVTARAAGMAPREVAHPRRRATRPRGLGRT